MDYTLFQEHTVHLFDLRHHAFEIKTVRARTLLNVHRFDLFAKLFYARKREENRSLALEVYLKHIKAFNPDGREPGRDDKTSFDDFVATYDKLLDYFENNEFDRTRSIIPVTSDGVILDGAHRIAALAYYDKEVTIAVFEGVIPKGQFDYIYFKTRGLPQQISDIIAKEILYWTPNCLVACMWPRMGDDGQKETAKTILEAYSRPFYQKSFDVSLGELSKFIAKVYRKQRWVGAVADDFAGASDKAFNCYAKGNSLELFFFTTSKPLEETLLLKEDIRAQYPYDKHSIHITDNNEETNDVAYFSLTAQGMDEWYYADRWKGLCELKSSLAESIYIFKKTKWLEFKVFLKAQLIKILRLS
jgi:hypothetical protein